MSKEAKQFFLAALQRTDHKPNMKDVVYGVNHIEFLDILDGYRKELGITDAPTETVRVIPGTEDPTQGRYLNSSLPVYANKDCDPNSEEGLKKILFNLRVMTGFQPGKNRKK